MNGAVLRQISLPFRLILSISLLYAWVLVLPFEGQVFYLLAEHLQFSTTGLNYYAIAAHAAGLLLAGLWIKTPRQARLIFLLGASLSLLVTILVILPVFWTWFLALIAGAFLSGSCVSAWALFLKRDIAENKRFQAIAAVLVLPNSLMIVINLIAVFISHWLGLALASLCLVGSFVLMLNHPVARDTQAESVDPLTSPATGAGLAFGWSFKPVFVLCLFILIVTINSGLMYRVFVPAFAHLTNLATWYWSLPYILVILMIRKIPKRSTQLFLPYVAMALLGIAFATFMFLDRSALSYLIIDTLMMSALGILDLFWWGILAGLIQKYHRPSLVFGVGLSVNVAGILLGEQISTWVSPSEGSQSFPLLMALTVISLTFVVLPILLNWMGNSIRGERQVESEAKGGDGESSEIATGIEAMKADHGEIFVSPLNLEKLTPRENQIASLLLSNLSYKEISERLYLSENTVKTHVKNIYAKIGVRNRSEMIIRMQK